MEWNATIRLKKHHLATQTKKEPKLLFCYLGFATNYYNLFKSGRRGEIRTPDILLPKQARYQATLHAEGQKYTANWAVGQF